MHDIIQVCVFENVEVDTTFIYDDINSKKISYIKIVNKDTVPKSRIYKRYNKKKTQSDLIKNSNKINMQSNYNPHKDKTIEEIKQEILIKYNFI